jgi:hypothetical protein
MRKRKSRARARISSDSLRNTKTMDCMVERGGFEPPVPLALTWAELGPSLAHYSARIKASVLESHVYSFALAALISGPYSDLGPRVMR